jgi:tetratricopeptide (TPR) repeat protein
MKLNKHFLLILITLSINIFWSCGLNLKLRLFDSTAVAQTVAYQKTKAKQLLEQGNKEFDSSEFYKALESWKQSLNLYREIGDSQGEAVSMGNIGRVHHEFGDYRTAIDYHQKSLNITTKIRDRKGEAASLNNIGSTYASLGDYNQAISYYTKSLAISQKIKDSEGEVISLGNLGSIYASLGDYNQAISYQKKSQKAGQSLTVVSSSGNAIAISQIQSQNHRNSSQQQSIAVSDNAIAISQIQSQNRQNSSQQQSITSVSSSSQGQYSSVVVAGNSRAAITINSNLSLPKVTIVKPLITTTNL